MEKFGYALGYGIQGALMLTRDPSSQGFEPGSYDLILATNVIHATPNLRRSLSNIRTLHAARRTSGPL